VIFTDAVAAGRYWGVRRLLAAAEGSRGMTKVRLAGTECAALLALEPKFALASSVDGVAPPLHEASTSVKGKHALQLETRNRCIAVFSSW
jgi:hypothetical protein